MGTALGKMLGETGCRVAVWVYEPELVDEINIRRQNSQFLPGFELPDTLVATASLQEALEGASIVLSVTPAQVLRQVWLEAAQYLPPDAIVVSASKGVETGTCKMMSEVLCEVIPGDPRNRVAFISGPSFAKEIADRQPTAVVTASFDEGVAKRVQAELSTPYFRIYSTDDVVGVELGGALKNVIAVAVGAAIGMNLGFNSQAALITRGLAELSRLAVACGANPLTLAGLAGIGDLVLTCTGHLSRNLQVGIRLGKGERLEEILDGMKMVAEGVHTAGSAFELAGRHGVEMPITEVVLGIVKREITPEKALKELMSRKPRSEREF